jgi:UDP-glucose 4-epimerase
MKAIVFGGSGFLGSHVADELSERGYKVVVYDRHESPYIRKDQEMIVGDILDREKVAGHVEGCNCVYSFAGVAGITDARRNPVEAIETNVLGTTHIADACRQHSVKRFVFASTVYVYSDLAPFYRSSKQACELIIEDYQKAYGLDYTILRYGSLYGRRANHFNYIYSIIQQAIEEGKIIRKGDGEEIRDYIHVEDAAKSSVDILTDEYKNQYVILTGTQSIKVRNLLYMIKEIFNGKIEIDFTSQSEEGHYQITPYSFRPRVAKKIIRDSYYDLGQGLLDIVYEVFAKKSGSEPMIEIIQKMIDRDIL